MSTLRIALAEPRELFEPPDYDPLAGRLERDPGIERVLKLLEGRKARDIDTLEIALADAPPVADLKAAVSAFCAAEKAEQRRLILLTRQRGVKALSIGLPVLGVCLAISGATSSLLGSHGFGGLIANSLIIAGWVAMWYPAELLLYEWWPHQHRMKLLDRLARLKVRVA